MKCEKELFINSLKLITAFFFFKLIEFQALTSIQKFEINLQITCA